MLRPRPLQLFLGLSVLCHGALFFFWQNAPQTPPPTHPPGTLNLEISTASNKQNIGSPHIGKNRGNNNQNAVSSQHQTTSPPSTKTSTLKTSTANPPHTPRASTALSAPSVSKVSSPQEPKTPPHQQPTQQPLQQPPKLLPQQLPQQPPQPRPKTLANPPTTLENLADNLPPSASNKSTVTKQPSPTVNSAPPVFQEAQAVAQPHSSRKPHYPRRAIQKAQQGIVILHFVLQANGRARDIQLVKSSGYFLLDKAVLKFVNAEVFHPALVNGIAVDSTQQYRYQFKLEK